MSRDEIDAFRERSIAAAEALFAKGGITAVTMRSLATELGCSSTLPYKYFENHEALVSALRASAFARFADDQHDVAETTEPPLKRLARIGRAYVDYGLANGDAYRLMFTLEPPRVRHPELELQTRRAFAPLLRAVEEAVKAGDMQAPAPVAAHLFWAQLHGLVSLHFANKFNFGIALEELASTFLKQVERSRSSVKARGRQK